MIGMWKSGSSSLASQLLGTRSNDQVKQEQNNGHDRLFSHQEVIDMDESGSIDSSKLSDLNDNSNNFLFSSRDQSFSSMSKVTPMYKNQQEPAEEITSVVCNQCRHKKPLDNFGFKSNGVRKKRCLECSIKLSARRYKIIGKESASEQSLINHPPSLNSFKEFLEQITKNRTSSVCIKYQGTITLLSNAVREIYEKQEHNMTKLLRVAVNDNLIKEVNKRSGYRWIQKCGSLKKNVYYALFHCYQDIETLKHGKIMRKKPNPHKKHECKSYLSVAINIETGKGSVRCKHDAHDGFKS